MDKNLLIRRLSISANKLLDEAEAPNGHEAEQMDLFTDYSVREQQEQAGEAAHARERKLQEAMLGIKKRYGKNAILKGMNLEDAPRPKSATKRSEGIRHEWPYDDIINLPHPTSKRHPRMPIRDRAAISVPLPP